MPNQNQINVPSYQQIKICLFVCKFELVTMKWWAGVEGVEVEMGKNLVTVKGIVDPQALCNCKKKSMRKATIISPVLPPPPPEGEAQPLVVLSQVHSFLSLSLFSFHKRNITNSLMQSNFVNSAISSTNLFKQILHMYMYAQLFNVLHFFQCRIPM